MSYHFERAVFENPAWATTITEPVEISGRCGLYRSPITHLSPLLHFLSNATFHECEIKVAEGKFHGSVSFRESRIEKIGNLITEPDHTGEAANFSFCRRLEIATGNYPGGVDFSDSGIRAIRKLTAINATFEKCLNLEDVPHDFLDLPSMRFGPQTLTRLREIEERRAQARQALKHGPIIEL